MADTIALSRDGVKHGKLLARSHFSSISGNSETGEITLAAEISLLNRANTPGKPVAYTSSEVHVFKARDRKPCMWFTLPATVFFNVFQPWWTRVHGAPLAHEYDEVDPDDGLDDSGVEDAAGGAPARLATLDLPHPGIKHGNFAGTTPFSRMTYDPATRMLTLECPVTDTNDGNTAYACEFFTCAKPVYVHGERENSASPSLWFTLPAGVFFGEFQPWYKRLAGAAVPERDGSSEPSSPSEMVEPGTP